MDRSHVISGLLATVAVITVGTWGAEARADQFVLFDKTFTYTKEDADNSSPSQSHYYLYEDDLNPERPTNWLTPVDYRNGSVHIRAEVIDKPEGGEITQWILCYIPYSGGYGCTGTGEYTTEGVYEPDVSMTSWWQNEEIDWSQGIKEMHLVIKDDDDGGGHAHKREDSWNFFPTTMRISMIQVSAGDTYDPSWLDDAGTGGSGGTAGTDAGTGGATGGTATGGTGGVGPAAGGTGGAASGGASTGGVSAVGGDTSTGGLVGTGAAPNPGGYPDPMAQDHGRSSGTSERGSCAVTASAPASATSAWVLGLMFAAGWLRRRRPA